MSNIKKHLVKLAVGIENNFDALALALRIRLKFNDPLQIVTFRSYGTVNKFYVRGRLLKDKMIRKPTDKDTIFNNLLSMYKRFESDEVPHALLHVNFQGKLYPITTDNEGYFMLEVSSESAIQGNDMWLRVSVELVNAPEAFSGSVKGDCISTYPSGRCGIWDYQRYRRYCCENKRHGFSCHVANYILK